MNRESSLTADMTQRHATRRHGAPDVGSPCCKLNLRNDNVIIFKKWEMSPSITINDHTACHYLIRSTSLSILRNGDVNISVLGV